MPSRRWRSLASSHEGRPSPALVSLLRCGAKMTQPVWPVQCSVSSAASFSGRLGSPALPKMLSTKSRLQTRPPGTKNRTSMLFSGATPGTSGQTTGRSRRETKHSAGSGSVEVKGNRISSGGGFSAAWSRRPKTALGTAFLSSGTGNPPSVTWKIPCVVRRSLFGLCSTPWRTR